ncbi:MAG: hypothetical protein R3F59_01465 [Myxococcota bacterium]
MYGIHPVHFCGDLHREPEIGYLTPPLRGSTCSWPAPSSDRLLQVVRSVLPFLFLMLLCLLLIALVPGLSLWLAVACDRGPVTGTTRGPVVRPATEETMETMRPR